ncbi:MAG TPA: branched-chain amino acid ABC transporter permease [Candidatus Limnocylindria bacterium]|nr:branched-chain amino acid ABC transporter permease [Candidatus Limnocylindria bacterium]
MDPSYYAQLVIAGVSNGAMYAVIAAGWALIFSVLKFSNFAHGGTMVVSAYVGMFVSRALRLNLWETLLVAAACGGLVNSVVEVVSFHRLRKSVKPVTLFFVSSITMGMLLQNIVAINFSGTYYAYPSFFPNRFRTYGSVSFDIANVAMLAVSAVAIGLLVVVLRRTRTGISIRAMSMDPRTTSLMGVNVDRVVLTTFFVAGALAGIAGVFVGIRTSLTPQIGSLYTIKGFMVCVIGGLGSLNGALYAAILLGLVETAVGALIGTSLAPVGTFLFMLVFLTLRPSGLAGVFAGEKA